MTSTLKTLIASSAIALMGASGAIAQDEGVLGAIKERDSLLCTGHNGSYLGFAEVDAQGAWQGFDIEMCRALATAITGSPDKLQIIPVSWAQRFPSLQSGDIDVIIKVTGWTMTRDTELGLTYSRPYFVGPFYTMTRKDLGATSIEDLAGGVFCAQAGTTVERILVDYMDTRGLEYEILAFEKPEELRGAIYNERCDAVPGFGPFLSATRVEAPDPDAFVILEDVMALEPEGIVVREGEDALMDVINWMVTVLLLAEQEGITMANVDEMKANPPSATVERMLGATPGVGARLGLSDDWAYNVIKTVGNYGEIYDRTIGKDSRYQLPRGLNNLWSNGGVMYPLVLD
ncbi:transporter substrate-binding domain-containing protein [Yoonia sp. SS1-5]|uniref:Transporter substrate-binding domain-containing protein n=1 Tax=Yoonia rhodophyticola TaxID=3137370 RepID=A0AAN0NH03_9RHOB